MNPHHTVGKNAKLQLWQIQTLLNILLNFPKSKKFKQGIVGREAREVNSIQIGTEQMIIHPLQNQNMDCSSLHYFVRVVNTIDNRVLKCTKSGQK